MKPISRFLEMRCTPPRSRIFRRDGPCSSFRPRAAGKQLPSTRPLTIAPASDSRVARRAETPGDFAPADERVARDLAPAPNMKSLPLAFVRLLRAVTAHADHPCAPC